MAFPGIDCVCITLEQDGGKAEVTVFELRTCFAHIDDIVTIID